MPLTITGEGYRDFSEPRFFECETEAQVQQIRMPVDKAHAFVSADDGSGTLALWKFDAASVAAASATVLIPDNPAYATTGRWISISLGSGGGGGGTGLSGTGSPEGVTTASPGTTYIDTAAPALYGKVTGTGNTGWQVFVS